MVSIPKIDDVPNDNLVVPLHFCRTLHICASPEDLARRQVRETWRRSDISLSTSRSQFYLDLKLRISIAHLCTNMLLQK
jgi:hypothetical protein